MTYTPRYTYWLYKINLKPNELSPDLASLIMQYESAFKVWQKSKSNEQEPYKKILEYTDAYISAKLYKLYEAKIATTEEDKLNDLLSKAADLDF